MFHEEGEEEMAMVCDVCGEDVEDKGVVAMAFEGDRELLCAFCFDEKGGTKKYYKVFHWGFTEEEEAIEALDDELPDSIEVGPRGRLTGQTVVDLFKGIIIVYVAWEVGKALVTTALRSLGFIKVLQLLGVPI